MLGGNLIGGYMHCRDLKYVNSLFRAYATDEKILETFKLGRGARHQHGLRDRRQLRGAVQPASTAGTCRSSRTSRSRPARADAELADHIKQQVDTGARGALCLGRVGRHVGPGRAGRACSPGPSRWPRSTDCRWAWAATRCRCPCQCEKDGVPCDFYVKTLHSDDYPSATPKELRKEFIWLNGGKGWYDNMWCINPEETIAFMKTVAKPWIAFKVLAAGAIPPVQAFPYAFKNGADFIAVGMFDFQIKADAELAERAIRHHQKRERAWRA